MSAPAMSEKMHTMFAFGLCLEVAKDPVFVVAIVMGSS
jgi:hypothetical protein